MFSKKTCGLPSNRPRATNGRPYGFKRCPTFNACRGGYYPPVIYKNSIAFCADDRWSPLQTLCGVIFLDCRGRRPRRPVYKISFCLKGPSRTPVPTGFGENFDILLVGEDIILPSCLTQCYRKAFPCEGRGTACGG